MQLDHLLFPDMINGHKTVSASESKSEIILTTYDQTFEQFIDRHPRTIRDFNPNVKFKSYRVKPWPLSANKT